MMGALMANLDFIFSSCFFILCFSVFYPGLYSLTKSKSISVIIGLILGFLVASLNLFPAFYIIAPYIAFSAAILFLLKYKLLRIAALSAAFVFLLSTLSFPVLSFFQIFMLIDVLVVGGVFALPFLFG